MKDISRIQNVRLKIKELDIGFNSKIQNAKWNRTKCKQNFKITLLSYIPTLIIDAIEHYQMYLNVAWRAKCLLISLVP